MTYQRRLTLLRANPDTGALVRRHSKVLTKPLCAIGRADGCDVVVRREYVGDPFHAVLTTGGAHQPGCTLQNMALPPCAPAQVNDRAVTGSIALRSGDLIGIAGRLFLYEETPSSSTPSSVAPAPAAPAVPPAVAPPVSPIARRAGVGDAEPPASPPAEESQAPLGAEPPATPPTAPASPAAPLFDDRVLQQCEAAAATGEAAPGALSADTDASASMSRGDSGLWIDTPDRRGAPRASSTATATPVGSKKRGRRRHSAAAAATTRRRSPSASSDDDDDDDDDGGEGGEGEEEEEEEETETRTVRRGRAAKRARRALFRAYKFVVSGVERKDALQAALEAEGGAVDDVAAWRTPPLFAAWEPFPRTLLLTEPDAAGGLVTTATVLLCLLCGVPCVDRRWADDSRAQHRLLPPRDYLLPIRLDVSPAEARAAGLAQPQQEQQGQQEQGQQQGTRTVTLTQPVAASLVAQGPDAAPLLHGAGGERPFQVQLHVHDQHGNRVPLRSVEQSFVHVWELILTTLGARVVRETRVHYDVNLHVVRASSSLQRSLKPAPARSSSRRSTALLPASAAAAAAAAAVPDVSSTWLTHSLLLNVQLPFADYLYTPPPRPLS